MVWDQVIFAHSAFSIDSKVWYGNGRGRRFEHRRISGQIRTCFNVICQEDRMNSQHLEMGANDRKVIEPSST